MSLLSESALARSAHVSPEKLWTSMRVSMKGSMRDQIRELADLDFRSLEYEIRHLIEIGLREERARFGLDRNDR
jgi:hypothetical protein